jgi:hypothetical protein
MLRRNVTVARNLLPFSEQGAESIFGAGGDVTALFLLLARNVSRFTSN